MQAGHVVGGLDYTAQLHVALRTAVQWRGGAVSPEAQEVEMVSFLPSFPAVRYAGAENLEIVYLCPLAQGRDQQKLVAFPEFEPSVLNQNVA